MRNFFLITRKELESIYYAQEVAKNNIDIFPSISKEFLQANMEAIENYFLSK